MPRPQNSETEGQVPELIQRFAPTMRTFSEDVEGFAFEAHPQGDLIRVADLPALEQQWLKSLLARIDHVELALSGIGHIEALVDPPEGSTGT